MIYDIKPTTEKLLYQAMEEFDFTNPPIDPVELANNLIETMKANNGIGLSANQCGLPYRVFALWSADPLVCFNPRVVNESEDIVSLEEGCLTYPNLFISIKRPRGVKLRYQDAFGNTHTSTFVGMTARGVLHELDHLNGVVFTKRATVPHLNKAWNQKKQLDRQIKRGQVYYKPSTLPSVTLDDNT